MKKVLFIFVFTFTLLNLYGQKKEFGFITITPYIDPETGVSGNTAKLLHTPVRDKIAISCM